MRDGFQQGQRNIHDKIDKNQTVHVVRGRFLPVLRPAVVDDDRAFVADSVNPEFHNVGVFPAVVEYGGQIPLHLIFEIHG